MGIMKKHFMDWCEQNGIPEEDMGWLLHGANQTWTKEFEQWLDTLYSQPSETEIKQMEIDYEFDPNIVQESFNPHNNQR